MKRGGEGTSSGTEFKASKGWFDCFKKRFLLKNIKLAGESPAADIVAAEHYCIKKTFLEIKEDNGYLPKQVFNADESAMFCIKMPTHTFISKEERHASGAKAAKDCLTMLFYANAVGYMIKPGLVYKVGV